ncbi:hypothetical protein EC991_004707 [Linnemannia zychae]|nr:hypothetical protein EC991_004707 [Linnemannia zychae]
MAKRLKDAGYCVYQLKYGVLSNFATIGGISDIRDSAKELDTFISKVLSITSAQKVDLIGHSEGTVVARWYLKFLDRQSQNQESDQQQQQQQQQEQEEQREQRESRVRSLVSIAPVGKGTSLQGLLAMSKVLGVFDNLAGAVQQYCVACVQLLEGSDLLLELYGGDGAQGEVKGVRYLNIITSRDDMVTPFTNGVMTIPDAPKATVAAPGEEEDEEEGTSIPETVPSHSWQLQNLVIENHCAFNPDHSNHFGIFQSPFAFHATNAFLSSYSDSDSAPLLDSNAIPCTLDPESS